MRTNLELLDTHNNTFRDGNKPGSPNRRLYRPHYVSYNYANPEKCN